MSKDLVGGSLGNLGSYDVSFKDGQLLASASVSLPPGESLAVQVAVDSDKVLDAIAAAVPGKLDDALIAVIKLALKNL